MTLADQTGLALTLMAALGCGLVAGVFFAFSSFVMKALAQIPAEAGIRAMQSINVVVLNPWFFGAFFGTGVICVAVTTLALIQPDTSGLVLKLAGSVVYLAGTLGVTMVCNVPRNERLAGVPPDEPAGEEIWREYLSSWTFWNHVRTIAALIAAALFCAALVN